MQEKLPLSKPFLNAEVEEAALRALRSGKFILGPECEAFEAELAAHTGVKHCVLGSSWTMSVYLLHEVQGVRPGDEIIVPSHTAFPTLEPLIHRGARPVFVDVDDAFVMDVAQAAAAITPRTVGLLPVHLYGHPADLDPLLALAARHHLWVIEDCAQAQGARYQGKTVGGLAHFGAFSFYPSKNLTVLGDGGCIATNDSTAAARLRRLRNHGRADKYTHEFPGYNVRFNEVNAAIGRVMLKHLAALNDHRRQIAAQYHRRLAGIVQPPPERDWARAVYHMYVIRCERRDELRKFLAERGIETGIHYPIPCHLQPALRQSSNSTARLPRTEQFAREILSLPIHGEMSLAAADRASEAIGAFYGRS